MRRLFIATAVLVAVVGAAVGGFLIARSRPLPTATTQAIATETVEIVRTTLVQTETLNGELRYRNTRPVMAMVAGVITRLPEEASTLERNVRAYEIDGSSAIVLYGSRPAWRVVREGVSNGADVRQLETNFVELGYVDLEPDRVFDDDTGDGIREWRDELGLSDVAIVERGRVLFLPEPVRVGALLVEVGASVAPGTPLFEVSEPSQEVRIKLDPEDLDLVAVGAAVEVELPDGDQVQGTVGEIGRVVAADPSNAEERFIEVKIELDQAVAGLDRAPVDVNVVSEEAVNVLAVPVRALLALEDGGYAVELANGSLVAVETGDFAEGLVEVRGQLQAGDMVVVPK